MPAVPSHRVRFGLFELDPATGELFREGVKVRVQGQPLQVLIALIERPGEVVTRDELREKLWRNDTFVDFDHGLNTAIKKMRAALGDSAENPRFIETLARRGYRFIAPVSATGSPIADASARSGVAPAHQSGSSDRPRGALAIAGVIAAIALAAGTILWSVRRDTATEAPVTARAPVRLAVLPLKVLGESGGRADEAYLGVGIADAIITRLAHLHGIALYPTAAVLQYADQPPDAAAAANRLNAEHVLVGTVQPTSNAFRVSVQLVRASDGVAIWARTYDMPRADLLRLQDNVAEQVVDVLALELTSLERARLRHPHTTNPAAYDAYLRGRARMANYTDATMRLAIADFEQAVQLDPSYALARAALATALAWFSVRYAYESEASEWGRRAEQEARAALTSDGDLAEAHLAIANAAGTAYRGFDWHTVLAESEKALSLDPTLELGHLGRMRAFYHVGRFAEATEAAARARLLNPAPNVEIDRVAIAIELFEGRYTAAHEQAQALLARTDAPAVRNYLGLARYYLGDVAGARETLASAKRAGQLDIRSQAALASVTAAARDTAEARRVIDFVLASGYMDHHVAYSIGAAYAQLGMIERSIEWLDRAATTGFSCQPWFARDPLLVPIRNDPAFLRLMDRMRGSK
jgi:DNA-binding winged helix-turn-helix (wHTH) protein/TolB-like protein